MPVSLEKIAREVNASVESVLHFLKEQELEDILVNGNFSDDDADFIRENSKDFKFIEPEDKNAVCLKAPFVVQDIADKVSLKPNKIVADLMKMDVLASVNQAIEKDQVEKLLKKYKKYLIIDNSVEEQEDVIQPEDVVHEENEQDRIARPSCVAVMGHVDHGKTSILDALRKTNVIKGEAGGITQHTGASQITYKKNQITFLDTPGHAAFSAMRKRGADITDIVLLVVAADDSVNQQTIEAIKIIQDAQVPMIIVINKMDLASADPERVLTDLQQHGILTEEWGGEYGVCKVSAHTKEGLDDLLDRILLESEIHELKYNPKLPGKAVVVEAQLEQGMGVCASILSIDGTLKVGDIVLCDKYYGKVRALIDSNNKRLKKITASTPVKLLGLSGVPNVGSKLVVVDNERIARDICKERVDQERKGKLKVERVSSLEELLSSVDENKKSYKVLIKADTQGTEQAIIEELKAIKSDKLNLDIIHSSVGGITASDVEMASSSGAKIIGFHVRVNAGVNKIAKEKSVGIDLYSVIYQLIDKVKLEMTDMLDASYEEEIIGNAEILAIFQSKKGKVCGSKVQKGIVKVNAHAKVYRNNDMIYNGSIKNLRHFKENVKEIKSGMECGILLDNFNDFEVHDKIVVYTYKEVKVSL